MAISSEHLRRKVYKVDKAKEWEAFRSLPKFKHKKLACINPTPKIKASKPAKFDKTLKIVAHALPLTYKQNQRAEKLE